MRTWIIVAAVILCASSLGSLPADERAKATSHAKETTAESQLRLLLVPSPTGKGFQAVAAPLQKQIPKHATLVTCDSMEFTKAGVVLVNATMETADQTMRCRRATVNAEKAAIGFSKDLEISLRSKAAKKRFLEALKR